MTTSSTRLGHIVKFSSSSYEDNLISLLAHRIGRDAAIAYRNDYLGAYGDSPLQNESLNTISVNISELCNFECVMCDVPGNNRKHRDLPTPKIIDFLEQAAVRNCVCCILGSGSEITLRRDWKQIVEKAIELFPDTILFTNGSLLSPSDIEFCVTKGLARLFISLDAAKPDTFKKIRGFDRLEDIEKKIHSILSLRRDLGSLSPLVRVSFVVQDHNINEVQDFKDKWLGVVDSVEFQDCYDISSFRDRTYVDKLAPVLPDENEILPSCHYPFSYLSLWADGKLSPCCTSYGRDASELKLASINDDNAFENALKSRQSLQEAFLSGDWLKLPNACVHCLGNR